MDNKDLYTEENIINALKSLLAGRVNELLEEAERVIPLIELSPFPAGGYLVTAPEVRLSTGERTEKDRIVGLEAYTLTITFTVPENPDGERNCYAYASAVATALKEDPTLGGAADSAFLFKKEYRAPKRADMGEPWEAVLTLRITAEDMRNQE
jgi:hypothetical protein